MKKNLKKDEDKREKANEWKNREIKKKSKFRMKLVDESTKEVNEV